MRISRRSVNLGLVASLATPALLRAARAEGETIKIGMVVPVTGEAFDVAIPAFSLDSPHQQGGVH